jgi:hypothetical protein
MVCYQVRNEGSVEVIFTRRKLKRDNRFDKEAVLRSKAPIKVSKNSKRLVKLCLDTALDMKLIPDSINTFYVESIT